MERVQDVMCDSDLWVRGLERREKGRQSGGQGAA